MRRRNSVGENNKNVKIMRKNKQNHFRRKFMEISLRMKNNRQKKSTIQCTIAKIYLIKYKILGSQEKDSPGKMDNVCIV